MRTHKIKVYDKDENISHGLFAEYETIYETNDVDDLIKEFQKVFRRCGVIDDVNCHIKIYDSTGEKTLCGYETEWLKTELEKYK
jgi:hypothetical protein